MAAEPLITPWVFYLASLADPVRTMATIFLIGIMAFFVCDLLISLAGLAESKEDYDERYSQLVKRAKRFIVVIILVTLAVVLTPNSKTILKMLIADKLTTDTLHGIQIN